MRIVVVGAGISGLTCAHLLSKEHEVCVLEKQDRIGGHTATVDVDYMGEKHSIDTGFIVFNDWTYPNFIELMRTLNVKTQQSSMGFSVSVPEKNLEYAGDNLNTLFSQRRNAVSPSFWRMLRDIVRFNKMAVSDIEAGELAQDTTLGEYLKRYHYSEEFCEHYLVPMGAAIWSAPPQRIREFPLLFFVRFFHNHGLLNILNRPKWHVIAGGSRQYISPLVRRFQNNIVTGANIQSIVRHSDSVAVQYSVDGQSEVREDVFDALVLATHSDQALSLLSDASALETEILSAIQYQENSVVLHTDTALLPSNKRNWSSWNYILNAKADEPPTLTYNMNILQGLESDYTYCVTLNADEKINSEKVLGRFTYAHPQFDFPAYAAQRRYKQISGLNNTWFCGAYWANGFHEDGVCSALRVARDFNSLS